MGKEGKRVLVYSDDISEEGGIRSRVLGELSTIGAAGQVTVVARIRARNLSRSSRFRKEFRSEFPDVGLHLVPVLPHGAFPLLRELGMVIGVLMLTATGIYARMRRKFESIYAHNTECALAGLVLGRFLDVPVAVDMHGDEVEENITINGWRRDGPRHRFWRRVEGIAIRRPKLLVCVSKAHSQYIVSEFERRGRIEIVPCCVDEKTIASNPERSRNLRALGLPSMEGVWLLYSGSSSRWQMLDTIASFHQSLLSAGVAANVLLLISDPRSVSSVRALFRNSPSDRVVVMSVPHSRVHDVSMAAHASMLFREDVPLNRISSPTKFAEYLAAGLPVMMTPGVGDYSDATLEHQLGQVVEVSKLSDPAYAKEAVDRIVSDKLIRGRCLEYVRANLIWESHRTILLEAYGLSDAQRS